MRCTIARKNISLDLDDRLEPGARANLQEHVRTCSSCREWQAEQAWLQGLVRAPREIAPSPGFHAGLRARIGPTGVRPARFSPLFLRPALRRAAVFLAFLASAVAGFFLGGRLEAPAAGAENAVFNQTMVLDAFADTPGDSFGGVYERLLRGELQ